MESEPPDVVMQESPSPPPLNVLTLGHSGLPPLPAESSVSRARYGGPTEESNWLIPDRLMVGAYPGAVNDDQVCVSSARVPGGPLEVF